MKAREIMARFRRAKYILEHELGDVLAELGLTLSALPDTGNLGGQYDGGSPLK